jgi:hypothetical protein
MKTNLYSPCSLPQSYMIFGERIGGRLMRTASQWSERMPGGLPLPTLTLACARPAGRG